MKRIYLDHAATTPLCKEALDAMQPYMTEYFANADSTHFLGQESGNAVLSSRDNIAKCIGAKSSEVYFTSSGSEADSWAIKGIAFANKNKGKHIITTEIEHPAVYNACEWLKKEGFDISYLKVNNKGLVSIEDVKNAIRKDTILISVMFANNEIGTIEPIKEICELAHENNILFHTDAVQATGSIKYDVKELGVDLLSLSAHKFFGPKGIGALYIKEGVKIDPLVNGGEQERGKRGGTTPVYLTVGMAKALGIAIKDIEKNNKYVIGLRQKLIEGIKDEDVSFNGNVDAENVLPGTISVLFKNTLPGIVLHNLDIAGIEASAGSACAAASDKPSRTLLGIGLSEEDSKRTVRFSIGKDNTIEDIDNTIQAVKKILERLKKGN